MHTLGGEEQTSNFIWNESVEDRRALRVSGEHHAPGSMY